MDEAPSGGRLTIRGMMAAVAIAAVLLGGLAWAGRTRFVSSLYWEGCSALELGTLIPWTQWAGGAGLVLGLLAIACDRRLWRARTLGSFLPFLLPVAILSYGIAFRLKSGMPRGISPVNPNFLCWLPWLHLPLALWLIARFPRGWLAAAGLSVAAGYGSFWSSMEAWMSVTNIWL